MMEVLLEKPFTISIAAVVLLLIVFYFWTQTRFKWLLFAMLAVVLGGVLLVVVEQVVITDREQIRATLTELSAAVGDNNKPEVMKYFAAGQEFDSKRAHASREMDEYVVSSCRIKRFEPFQLSPRQPGQPKRCKLTVYVAGSGHYRSHQGNGASKVTLDLVQDSQNEWKIEDFIFTSPIPKLANRP